MPKYATSAAKSGLRELRREQIENAALKSILRHGFSASSLRVVAKEANVPLSILHYYFKDKDELMHAAVERIFRRSLKRLAEASARESDPVRRVEALLEAYVMRTTEEWQSTLAVIEYWAACVRRRTVDRFYTQLHFGYRELLTDSLRKVGAEDPEGLALALLAMMVGYATFYKSKPADPGERERFLKFARGMVRRGVAHGRRRVTDAARGRATHGG